MVIWRIVRVRIHCRYSGMFIRALCGQWCITLAVGGAAALGWSDSLVAGVTPDVSRVVFPPVSLEQSLQVFNVNKYPVLVQAWVDDGKITALPQESKAPVIVLPPIFRLGPGDQTSVRLINAGEQLPRDRESIFWLNLYEIPATSRSTSANAQTVTVTMRTQIKVFVRPQGLPYPPGELLRHLEFSLAKQGGQLALTINNSTPYFATIGSILVSIADSSQEVMLDMLSPFSHATLLLSAFHANAGENAKVQFSLIGDDGNSTVGERHLVVGGEGAISPPTALPVSYGIQK